MSSPVLAPSKVQFLDLPLEILKLIFNGLRLAELAVCARVSKTLSPLATEMLYLRADLLRCRRKARPGQYLVHLTDDLRVAGRLERQALTVDYLGIPGFRASCMAYCQDLRLDLSSRSIPLAWLVEALGAIAGPQAVALHRFHVFLPEERLYAILPILLSCRAQFVHAWIDVADIADPRGDGREAAMRLVIDCELQESILFLGDMPKYLSGRDAAGGAKMLAIAMSQTSTRRPDRFVQWMARIWPISAATLLGALQDEFLQHPLRHLMIRMFRKKARYSRSKWSRAYYYAVPEEVSDSTGSEDGRHQDGTARRVIEEADELDEYTSIVCDVLEHWTAHASDPLETLNFYGLGAGWVELIKSLKDGNTNKLGKIENHFWVDCLCSSTYERVPAAECTSTFFPDVMSSVQLGETRLWSCAQLFAELKPCADAQKQHLTVEHVRDGDEHCFIGIRFLKELDTETESKPGESDAASAL